MPRGFRLAVPGSWHLALGFWSMMDDSYGLSTPEQVELAYDVAGLGSRFVAALIDVLIQSAVILALVLVGVLGGGLGTSLGRDWFGTDGTRAGLIALALVALGIFVVIWGYYIFFEIVWNGQSPGKRRLGLRVLTTGGRPIGATHAIVRNLVRLVDFLPSSYMLGAAVMLLNGRAQRLGDLAAGTIVVKERHELAPRILMSEPGSGAELAPQEAAAFEAEDVALAREFLLRRYELDYDRRQELAERIAGRFRARLGPEAAREPAETLLARVAALRR